MTFKNMARELSDNKTLRVGILLLATALLLSLLSLLPKYRLLSLPAAILAVFGAFLAVKGYITFLRKLKTHRS